MEYSVSVKVTQSCLTLCDPMGYTVHEILPARILEWGSHSLLQGVFPTQGSNLGLLHCRQSLPSRPPEHPDGILVCHKKEQINATCSNTDGPRDCHSEWSESDTDKLSYIAYIWNLKNGYKWTYLQNRSRVMNVENKLVFTRRWERWINWDWHIHTKIYKIDNYKNLLYSTENCTQYSVKVYMGKESKKKRVDNMYMCNSFTVLYTWNITL